MPFLSPAKLLVIVAIAIVVLGPDKLPKAAKQIGGLWRDFRAFRQRLESEVRGNFPDLPSSDTITRAVRSPLSFLDDLADTRSTENGTTSGGAARAGSPDVDGDVVRPSAGANRPADTVQGDDRSPTPALAAEAGNGVHRVRSDGGVVADDPGMN